ncbi:SHOCT domain-containing protein [Actinophytocola sp. NPDC049390]|uniref:SHOCT domain-containing protein n=1 Tax=Actinophytocola sp. NPDC049390 TaxID=3363894 RepID=UPI003799C2C3
MPYWDHDHAGGWGWFGVVMMIVTLVVFWGGLGTIAYLVLRGLGRGRGGGHEVDRTADRILDERFARGEIDADELTARRSALRRATTR